MVQLLLSASAFLFGMTLVVSIKYWLRWKRLRPQPALLPLHIWTVALSYDLLLLGVAFQALTRVRWWHPYIYLPAMLLGAVAMVVIVKHQHDNRHSH